MRRHAKRFLAVVLTPTLAFGSFPIASGAKTNQWISDLRSNDRNLRLKSAYDYSRLEPLTTDTVLKLVRGLKDPNSYVRRYCASALGEIDLAPAVTVPALMQALMDRDEDVREH